MYTHFVNKLFYDKSWMVMVMKNGNKLIQSHSSRRGIFWHLGVIERRAAVAALVPISAAGSQVPKYPFLTVYKYLYSHIFCCGVLEKQPLFYENYLCGQICVSNNTKVFIININIDLITTQNNSVRCTKLTIVGFII